MKRKADETPGLLDSIIAGIFEKQGERVVKLDMRKLENRVSDYFIICHGKSTTQVDAIAESVVHKVKTDSRIRPVHKEGQENSFWVLIDFGGVIVHVFLEEHRGFYNLEALWADASSEVLEDKGI